MECLNKNNLSDNPLDHLNPKLNTNKNDLIVRLRGRWEEKCIYDGKTLRTKNKINKISNPTTSWLQERRKNKKHYNTKYVAT